MSHRQQTERGTLTHLYTGFGYPMWASLQKAINGTSDLDSPPVEARSRVVYLAGRTFIVERALTIPARVSLAHYHPATILVWDGE